MDKKIYVNIIIPTIFYNYRYNYGLMFYCVLLIDVSIEIKKKIFVQYDKLDNKTSEILII